RFREIEPPPFAAVFFGRSEERVERCLRGTPWAALPRHGIAPGAADHEGAGGVALVMAGAARPAGAPPAPPPGGAPQGPGPAALVVGAGKDRGHAILFARDEDEAAA